VHANIGGCRIRQSGQACDGGAPQRGLGTGPCRAGRLAVETSRRYCQSGTYARVETMSVCRRIRREEEHGQK
jgi:hypothetical protein